jgi:antiviral helicase SKI2
MDECDKLIDIEKKWGVIDTEYDKDKRINFYFYELMYAWAEKKSFIEIVQLAPFIDEGTIVKMINSVERLCAQVKEAARVIGDAQLA